MDAFLPFFFVDNIVPLNEDDDWLRWTLKNNGNFDIRSHYNVLRDSSSITFPWKGIWGVKAPRWVSFFVWIVAWNKILTRVHTKNKGFDFVDWCCMCRHCGKTVDHLLINCEKAQQLWCIVLRSFGVSLVLPRAGFDLIFGWRNWLGKHLSDIWNLVPLCLLWCIWRERNRCTFEDVDSSDDQLLASFSGYWFDCSRTWGLTSCDSIPLFISSLLFCN